MASRSAHIDQKWIFTGEPSLFVLEDLMRNQPFGSQLGQSILAVRLPARYKTADDCSACFSNLPKVNIADMDSLKVASLVPCFIPEQQLGNEPCSSQFCRKIRWLQDQGVTLVFEEGSDRSDFYLNHPPRAVHLYAHLLWNRPQSKNSSEQEKLPAMCKTFFRSAKQNSHSVNDVSVAVFHRIYNKEIDRRDTEVICEVAKNEGYSFLLRRRIDKEGRHCPPSKNQKTTFIELIFNRSNFEEDNGYLADIESGDESS